MKIIKNKLKQLSIYLNTPDFVKDILILSGCLYIFVFLSFYFNYLSDDAFITFRYVKNFLQGLGPVYNKGEYVEGFTSPLWFLLISFFGKLGADIIIAGRGLSLLFGILQIILLYFFLKRIKISEISRFLALLFISLSNIMAVWSLGGLEITMYSFLLLLSFVFFVLTKKWNKKNLLIFSVISVLLFLTRLEGLFVPVLALTWFSFKVIRNEIKFKNPVYYYFLPFAAILFLSFYIRYSLYGQLLPNTFYAKVGGTIDLYIRGLRYVFDFFLNYGLIIFFAGLIIAGFLNRTKIAWFTLLFLFSILAETIVVGGDGLPMYRFLLPALPYLAILFGFLLENIKKNIPNLQGRYVLIFGLTAIMIYRAVSPPFVGDQYMTYLNQKQLEIPRWTLVGQWLNKHTKPGETIALVPIGAVGYYSDRYIYDMLGLTNKYIAHKKMELGKGIAGHEKFDGPYILSQRPTYLLLGNIMVLDFELSFDDPRFARPFNTVIMERENDIYTDDLWKNYEKKIADVGGGYYLHYFKLKVKN